MTGTCTRYQGTRGTTWHGRYTYLDPATSGRVWKRLSAPTKKACQEAITAAVAKINAGAMPNDGKLTLGALLTRWLDTHETEVRATTHRRYAGIVRTHLADTLGRRSLTKLSALDIQGHYTAMLRAGTSASTVAYTHTVLRTALNQAMRWGLLDRNVATAVKPPRVTVAEFPTWTETEVGRVLAVADTTELAAFWRIALMCGLRRGELMALWWEDVDLDRGTLAVRRTFQKAKSGWTLGPPKTTASRRSLALPASCVTALRQHQDRQAFQRQRLGDLWYDGPGFVFTNQTGGPLHVNTVIDAFARLIADAGVPRIRFHDCRHSCATLHLAHGVHPKIVQEMLGHSSIVMTLDTYSHSLAGMQRSAMDALDAALAPPAGEGIANELPKFG